MLLGAGAVSNLSDDPDFFQGETGGASIEKLVYN